MSVIFDLKGPVLSSVAKLLFDVEDVNVGENAKSERVGVSKPDQAGYLPCYFYICSDFDDMRPEREFLAKEIWPAVDQLPGQPSFSKRNLALEMALRLPSYPAETS